jgi:DNA invertase Pin-like site-specific DNA recombinase
MKCALYLRVSKQEQTTDNQLPVIQDYAKSRGYFVDSNSIYRENESAWKSGHQKDLARLLSDLESGKRKYDAVIVWSLDRLTREGIGSLLTLYNRFNKYGCKVLSLKESWTEIPNEMTPIFLAMIGFFAKWESDRKSERTKAGQARMLKSGVTSKGRVITQLGRPQGSKDKQPRKRTGYLLRYANKGAPRVESEVLQS